MALVCGICDSDLWPLWYLPFRRMRFTRTMFLRLWGLPSRPSGIRLLLRCWLPIQSIVIMNILLVLGYLSIWFGTLGILSVCLPTIVPTRLSFPARHHFSSCTDPIPPSPRSRSAITLTPQTPLLVPLHVL
jgi:hypothetical protein